MKDFNTLILHDIIPETIKFEKRYLIIIKALEILMSVKLHLNMKYIFSFLHYKNKKCSYFNNRAHKVKYCIRLCYTQVRAG